MRKIPTLFRRSPADRRRVLREVEPGCEWVLAGEGVATRKPFIPWPRQCGFCRQPVEADEAGLHWQQREGVSRCAHRWPVVAAS